MEAGVREKKKTETERTERQREEKTKAKTREFVWLSDGKNYCESHCEIAKSTFRYDISLCLWHWLSAAFTVVVLFSSTHLSSH